MRFLAPAIMVAVSLTIGLAITEGVLYLVYRDVQVGGADTPSGRTFYPKYYHLNSWGFRDVERKIRKAPGVHRILVLGDSFTFGAGVKYKEDLYPSLLERKLNGTQRWEVINSGVKGFSTAQELDYFLDKGLALRPDLVIVGHVLNDAETPEMKEALVAEARRSWLPDRLHRFLYAHSFTYYLTLRAVDGLISDWRHSAGFVGYDAYLHEMYQGNNFAGYTKIVEDLAQQANCYDIPVIWVSFPHLRYLHLRPYPFADVREKIRELVAKHGFAYLDLYEPLRASGAQVLTVSKWDDHPNELVQAIAADQIYDLLVSSGLVQMIEGEKYQPRPEPGKTCGASLRSGAGRD
jgi:GDSL-like Lipase/Acylhydrolase family